MYSTFLEELQVSTFIVPLPHSAAFRQSLNCRPKFLCVQQPIIVTCTLIPTVPSLVMGAGFSIQEKGNWDETSDLSQGYLAFCLPCSHPQSSGFSFWVPIVPSRGVLPGMPRGLVTSPCRNPYKVSLGPCGWWRRVQEKGADGGEGGSLIPGPTLCCSPVPRASPWPAQGAPSPPLSLFHC